MFGESTPKRRLITGLVLCAILALFFFWYHFQAQNGKTLGRLRVGMSRNEVKSLLGPPRRIQPEEPGERWDYSSLRFPDVRVWFDTNGIVYNFGSK